MDHVTLADDQTIQKTIDALAKKGVEASVVDNRAQALKEIKSLIPATASVMNGSSATLKEIGFIDYLKSGNHPWRNLHAEILAENDPEKQAVLRKQSVLSDFYLGSTNAVAQTGQLVFGSNSGSQMPHLTYTSPNLVFIVGTQKITPDLDSAVKRLREYVQPLEDQKMKNAGAPGSKISKLLIFEREPKFSERKVKLVFVKEKLGF